MLRFSTGIALAAAVILTIVADSRLPISSVRTRPSRLAPATHAPWRNHDVSIAVAKTAANDAFAAMAADDCRWVLDHLSTIPDLDRDAVRDAALRRLTTLDPDQAAAYAASLRNPDAREDALRLVMNAWIEHDVAAATRWLMRLQEPLGDDLRDTAIDRWASDDFGAALSWTRAQPDGTSRERLLVHLSYLWLEQDPRGALEFARSLPSSTHQLLATLASEWAQRSPDDAATWARNLPPGSARTQAIAAIAASWARVSPTDAAMFAATMEPGDTQRAAITSVVSNWTLREPAAAAAWTMLLPDPTTRDIALTQLLTTWAKIDAAGAAEWLLAAGTGASGRDAAFDSLSGAISDQFPGAALSFAAEITDPAQRRARLELIARRWLATNAAAAVPALRQAGVPDELIAKLTRTGSR